MNQWLKILIFLAFRALVYTISDNNYEASWWRVERGMRSRRWTFGKPPYFDEATPTNHTAQIGSHAHLTCKVRNLGNKTVSWVRSRDSHILTIDRYTFIADERFSSWFDVPTKSWVLQIKYVQERDAGTYECQISTEPKMHHSLELVLMKPTVEIKTSELYVRSGSQVTIDCIIHNSLTEPQYIFWYHDGVRLVGDENFLLKLLRRPPLTTVATLNIENVLNTHSGNYTCEPARLKNVTVSLHVLAEEQPAAMQHEISSSGSVESCVLSAYSIYYILLFSFCQTLFFTQQNFLFSQKFFREMRQKGHNHFSISLSSKY